MTAGYLGNRRAVGIAATAIRPNPYVAGGWLVPFPADEMPPTAYEVYHAAVRGPGGTFVVYVGGNFYSVAERGDINEYDPKHPIFVRPGEDIVFYWSIATGAAPQVWLYLREPGQVIL